MIGYVYGYRVNVFCSRVRDIKLECDSNITIEVKLKFYVKKICINNITVRKFVKRTANQKW